jgi:hypothetical protein
MSAMAGIPLLQQPIAMREIGISKTNIGITLERL